MGHDKHRMQSKYSNRGWGSFFSVQGNWQKVVSTERGSSLPMEHFPLEIEFTAVVIKAWRRIMHFMHPVPSRRTDIQKVESEQSPGYYSSFCLVPQP